MTVFHYSNERRRDLTIEVSNMVGCPVGCTFCASKEIEKKSTLDPIGYLKQVNTCIDHGKIDINQIQDFQVSFAGIGEPSLVAEKILEGGRLIAKVYPSVRFNIATCGLNPNAFKIWKSESFPIRTIQIPYYHYDYKFLKKVCPHKKFPVVTDILPLVLFLSGSNQKSRVKINYILIKNYNDSLNDINQFLTLIRSYRQSLTIKLSFLNPTDASKKQKLCSPGINTFKSIHHYICEKGYSCYIFGTISDPQLGCGQLASQSFTNKSR